MKKLVMVLAVVLVVCIGFYCGYRQATHSKVLSDLQPIYIPDLREAPVIEIDSSMPNEKIRLEYKIDPHPLDDPHFHSVIQKEFKWSPNVTIKSSSNIQSIHLTGNFYTSGIIGEVVSDDTASWKIETDPLLDKKHYNFDLRFPYHETREKVLDLLSKQFGFTYLIEDTTIIAYRATWNGQPVLFTVSLSQKGSRTTNSLNMEGDQISKFQNFNVKGILGLYENKFRIRIKDGTGLKDSYDGEIHIPHSLEDAKDELLKQTGIELVPYDIPIKVLTLKVK